MGGVAKQRWCWKALSCIKAKKKKSCAQYHQSNQGRKKQQIYIVEPKRNKYERPSHAKYQQRLMRNQHKKIKQIIIRAEMKDCRAEIELIQLKQAKVF